MLYYLPSVDLSSHGMLYYLPSVDLFKINESQHVVLFAVSGSIEKRFSVDCVNINLFSIFFSIDFARWKSVGLPRFAYIGIH